MIRRLPLLLAPLALLVVLAAGCGSGGSKSGSSSASLGPGIVAIVGNDKITQADFNEIRSEAEQSYKVQKRPFPKVGSPDYQTLVGQIMAFLVQRSEFAQKATELGVKVTDKQIEARLVQIKKQYFAGDEKRYQQQLKQQGETDQQVHEGVKALLLEQGIETKVTSKIPVTDAEQKAYYQLHLVDQYAPKRTVRHILVKQQPLANSIYKQLKGGADFAALAKKYSQDPGSKKVGGKLTITKGQTVAPFDKVAFSLKTNEISKPVHSQFGWHVIQALTPVMTTPFAKVKDSIRQLLLQQKKSQTMQAWVDAMKAEFAKKTQYAKGFEPPATTTATTATAPPTTG